jgi:biopolymer transport protein TolQ
MQAADVAAPDLSIIGLIAQADLVVKTVMFLLLLGSFWSWAIIFDKWMRYRTIQQKIDRFEKLFWSGQVLDQLYERIKNRADHPMALVFVAAMHEWSRGANIVQTVVSRNAGVESQKTGVKERISQAMHVAMNREMEKLQRNLSFLAIIGSSGPFIGLFGTVWGIMNSFQAIAASKNTTLAVVAPGIAEALFATAIGLFAAIPAVMFYNILTNKVNYIWGRVEDFSIELNSLLSRELDEGSKS